MSGVLKKCAFCGGLGVIEYEHEHYKRWEEGTPGASIGIHGAGRMVTETVSKPCPACLGQGLVPVPTTSDGSAVPCKVCDGGGLRRARDPDDRSKPIPCKACYGSGWSGFRPAPDS